MIHTGASFFCFIWSQYVICVCGVCVCVCVWGGGGGGGGGGRLAKVGHVLSEALDYRLSVCKCIYFSLFCHLCELYHYFYLGNPNFLKFSGKAYRLDCCISQSENLVFRALFFKLDKMYSFDPTYSPFVAFWVTGREMHCGSAFLDIFFVTLCYDFTYFTYARGVYHM